MRYLSFGSARIGDQALLKGLILVLDAKVVVETGFFNLDTTRILAEAVVETKGVIYTFDIQKPEKDFLHPRVRVKIIDGAEGIAEITEQIDLAFLDSAPQEVHTFEQTKKECEVLIPKLSFKGTIVIHDVFYGPSPNVAKDYKNIAGYLKEKGFNHIGFRETTFTPSISIFKKEVKL